MADYTLARKPAYDALADSGKWNGFTVSEQTHLPVCSIASAPADMSNVSTNLKKVLKVGLPENGKIETNGDVTICPWAINQWMLLGGTLAANELADQLGDGAWVTNQSDGQVVLAVSGDKLRSVFEKLCPLDLHENAFETGMAARTSFEGISAVIIRKSEHEWMLVIPRSSRGTFMDNLVHAARSTCHAKS